MTKKITRDISYYITRKRPTAAQIRRDYEGR